jgi:hypothetical protein
MKVRAKVIRAGVLLDTAKYLLTNAQAATSGLISLELHKRLFDLTTILEEWRAEVRKLEEKND